ncbi:MAG: hypothetical protein AAGN46_06055 [Acidobacteriota bacterium]
MQPMVLSRPWCRSMFVYLAMLIALAAAAPADVVDSSVVPAGTVPAVSTPPPLTCSADRGTPLLPADPELCERLWQQVKDPSALPLDRYEEVFGDFARNFCHRDRDRGWKADKSVRDTGPYTARFDGTEWVGAYGGTHSPVVIWYSPIMLEWMAANRPATGEAPENPPPIPDGAAIIKEMYPVPAAACADVEDVTHLLPSSGAAIMVRDNDASHDGWFWGWFGWSGWDPDWPAGPNNRLAFMGFGQYCTNCHASAADNLTFSDLKNVEGEPGTPLVFLSQHFYDFEPATSHHRLVTLPGDDAEPLGSALRAYDATFEQMLPATTFRPASWGDVVDIPSQTYDVKWVTAGGVGPEDTFVTSDQCLGCHDAGGTGLQFDMTRPASSDEPDWQGLLVNQSPYATWVSSPMGMGGRDPIFYAQLASETETFHPQIAEPVQDICLGCHGVTGQRQYKIDTFDATGECSDFLRSYANAVPYPHNNPSASLAPFGALARDGINCTTCHHMKVGEGNISPELAQFNRCLEERQDLLNPQNTGFAKTFTGSFVVGPADEVYGPFEGPKQVPMEHALGIQPTFDASIRNSEVCGSCHTVHLPVYPQDRAARYTVNDPITYTYEQTTYPEWLFSAYRTDVELPSPRGPIQVTSAGSIDQSCQNCHMKSLNPDGSQTRSKIAIIQEYSNFPQAENSAGPEALDLPIRGGGDEGGFARHTLAGLNVFFVKMAQQFPEVLGIRTQDPMLVSKGVDPLLLTEQKMLDQASDETASLTVELLDGDDPQLVRAKVTVENRVGHKFPSGVGFRRAFLQFDVVDAAGNVLWASGRTNSLGMLVDGEGNVLDGELWYDRQCERLHDRPVYQPHYQVIRRQDQAQIYQELVTSPAEVADPRCGEDPTPGGLLTTSFLSICGHEKDNRLLPKGFLPWSQRVELAAKLGAGASPRSPEPPGVALANDVGSHATGDDPDYLCPEGSAPDACGGGDRLIYEVDLREIAAQRLVDARRDGFVGGPPHAVRAGLFYQAIPPFYLQDRFCTSGSDDTQRLYFLAGHLNLDGTQAQDWKLEIVSSGEVLLPSATISAETVAAR